MKAKQPTRRELLRMQKTQEYLRGELRRAADVAHSIVGHAYKLSNSPLVAAYGEEIEHIAQELARVRHDLRELRDRDADDIASLNVYAGGEDDDEA